MGKRDLLAEILIKSGVAHILHKGRLLFRRELPVLGYHRILDTPDIDKYPYDKNVISASIQEFDEQIMFIKNNYTPIDLQDLDNYIKGKKPLPKNPIMITFDDGFDDNYHNAYPILKKYNVPAVIFIATDHIESNQTFWFERLSKLILTTKQTDFHIPEINFKEKIPNSINEKRRIYAACVEKMKYIDKQLRQKIMDRIEDQHNSNNSESSQNLSQTLNWQQCREMASDVFTFGSHGTSHTIFTQLSKEELSNEFTGSKIAIEENLTSHVTSLAFPNGQLADFNADIIETAKQHGYKFIFSYLHGMNLCKDIKTSALKRIHPPRIRNLSHFKLRLSLPEIF